MSSSETEAFADKAEIRSEDEASTRRHHRSPYLVYFFGFWVEGKSPRGLGMYVWDVVNPQHSHLGALPTVGAVPKEEKRGALISRVVR